MPPRPKTLRCNHGERRQALVQSLLTAIFQGELRAGQRLVARGLAERFKVSQTPIREALIELAGIGVLDLLPNRGAVVRKVTRKDVRDILQTRKVLECEATRRACGRIDSGALEVLAQDLRGLIELGNQELADSLEKARAVDSRLHDLIASSSGNDFLAHELDRLKLLFRAFRDINYQRREERKENRRLADESREHLAIVEALLNEDGKEACRAMARHLRSGVRYWTRILPDEKIPFS